MVYSTNEGLNVVYKSSYISKRHLSRQNYHTNSLLRKKFDIYQEVNLALPVFFWQADLTKLVKPLLVLPFLHSPFQNTGMGAQL